MNNTHFDILAAKTFNYMEIVINIFRMGVPQLFYRV